MTQPEQRLTDAAYRLAEEIHNGCWKHVADIARQPAPACTELIVELQRRCPGFSEADYQRALANGLFESK